MARSAAACAMGLNSSGDTACAYTTDDRMDCKGEMVVKYFSDVSHSAMMHSGTPSAINLGLLAGLWMVPAVISQAERPWPVNLVM